MAVEKIISDAPSGQQIHVWLRYFSPYFWMFDIEQYKPVISFLVMRAKNFIKIFFTGG
jgi:hypothetical protein